MTSKGLLFHFGAVPSCSAAVAWLQAWQELYLLRRWHTSVGERRSRHVSQSGEKVNVRCVESLEFPEHHGTSVELL